MKKGMWILVYSLLAKLRIFSLHGQSESCDLIFPTPKALEDALSPLALNEVKDRIAMANSSYRLNFRVDGSVIANKILHVRNLGVGNLLNTEVYRTDLLTVYCPEIPRVPHHVAIALNRKDVKGFSNIAQEENFELFATIKKIAEIYKTVAVQGFVIAQYDTPQEGHSGRFVVELIPHLPGFNDIKNTVDKVESNRYVLFRKANISQASYKVSKQDALTQAAFWKSAFQRKTLPLFESDTRIAFPYTRKEAFQKQAEALLCQQLLEILQDEGAFISSFSPFNAQMPCHVPEEIKSIRIEKCAFCNDDVIRRQLVYEYEDVAVFYNMRKSPDAGSCFLILPKRHTEKVYGLNDSEIRHIGEVRKALAEVLKESHPGCEVIVYIQDDPAIGQTVFHSHEQIVAADPKKIALWWTMMSLFPSGNVSDEEMSQVQKEYGLKLEKKLKEIIVAEKSA